MRRLYYDGAAIGRRSFLPRDNGREFFARRNDGSDF
jgi:hypothetical protein